MTDLRGLVEYWDQHIRRWIDGDTDVPAELTPWFDSYRGSGRGEVRVDVFPEPYTGRLLGNNAPIVMLGLNPGAAVPRFQSPGGVFFQQLQSSAYHEWASTVPYASTEWESFAGPNRFYQNRFSFARRLLDDNDWPSADGVFFELYPWHSSGVTAAMNPPASLVREYLFEPIAGLDASHVFAFGKPWFAVAERLGLGSGRDFAASWRTPSRVARAYALPGGQDLIVMSQNGYAGPPGAEDTLTLARALGLR